MKCANCGAELRVGCVYCSKCGKEAQIVSDYNLLEDDFLRNMLQEPKPTDVSHKQEEGKEPKPSGTSKGKPKPSGTSKGKPKPDGRQKTDGKKKKSKKNVSWAIFAILFLVALVAAIAILIYYGRYHSYGYQMDRASACYSRRDYEKARKYLFRALELEEDDVEARMLLSEVYIQQEEMERAIGVLQEAIGLDREYEEAYQSLIRIYEMQKDYAAIHELYCGVEDPGIQLLFEEYTVDPPVFEPEEGTYHEVISVEISAQIGCTTYYTLDGSDPKQGQEYAGPIPLDPGKETTIRAISCNEYGIYGEETEGKFQIELLKPEPPRVMPQGGSFYNSQAISVYVPMGCQVYYTWDGSVPTRASERYTEPIAMPEGNNILSLILVDEYGMSSDVLRCNYIYMP
ncbi:chitobiase/beta-hexosaminidase C-terminal domain-containing protein [Lachnospiraceae bacterium 29-84]